MATSLDLALQPYFTNSLTKSILRLHGPDTRVQYWRDKAGNEVDFVLPRGREAVDAIECKWNPSAFDGRALAVFRSYYAKGRNYLVTRLDGPAYSKRLGKLEVSLGRPSEIEG